MTLIEFEFVVCFVSNEDDIDGDDEDIVDDNVDVEDKGDSEETVELLLLLADRLDAFFDLLFCCLLCSSSSISFKSLLISCVTAVLGSSTANTKTSPTSTKGSFCKNNPSTNHRSIDLSNASRIRNKPLILVVLM